MTSSSAPELRITPITLDQLPAIYRLEESCFKDPYPPAFLAELAECNPETFLVGTTGERVVGYAVATQEPHYSHLISIAVHPGNQGNGVGHQLLRSLEQRLDGNKPIRLEVRESNTSAIRFYVKNGFRRDGMEIGYYSDRESAVLMRKDANKP